MSYGSRIIELSIFSQHLLQPLQSEQPILTVCEWLYSFAKAMGMFVVGEVVEVVVV